MATKTIPEQATCARRYAAGGLVCATIRRTVAGDAATPVLFAPVTANAPPCRIPCLKAGSSRRFTASPHWCNCYPLPKVITTPFPAGYWIIRWRLPATPSGYARVICCHQKRARKNKPGRPVHGRSRWSAQHCCTIREKSPWIWRFINVIARTGIRGKGIWRSLIAGSTRATVATIICIRQLAQC